MNGYPFDYVRAEEAQCCPSLRYKAESLLPNIDQFIGSLDPRLHASSGPTPACKLWTHACMQAYNL